MNIDYNDISDYSKKIEKKFQSIIDNELIDIAHAGEKVGTTLFKSLYLAISQTYMRFVIKFLQLTTHINGLETAEERIGLLFNTMKKTIIEIYEKEKE